MHKAAKPRRSWRHRVVSGGVTLGLCAGIVFAAAAWLGDPAPIKGGVDSAKFDVGWVSGTAANITEDGMDCAAAVTSGGALSITAQNSYPGGTCDITAKLRLAGGASESGVVSDLNLTLPDGWTAKLVNGSCGRTIGTTDSMGVSVTLRLTMTEQAAAGSSGEFAAGDAVTVVPVSLKPSTLPCQAGA